METIHRGCVFKKCCDFMHQPVFLETLWCFFNKNMMIINGLSSAGYQSAAAGLKAWVAEGRVGTGRFLQATSSSSSSFRGQLLPVHLPTPSLTPLAWKLHLLRNWKIHKWNPDRDSDADYFINLEDSPLQKRQGIWVKVLTQHGHTPLQVLKESDPALC